MYWYNDYRRK